MAAPRSASSAPASRIRPTSRRFRSPRGGSSTSSSTRGRDIQPDYVILSPEELDQWDRHPLRADYRLVANLGDRRSYQWFERWRVPSQARIAALVFAK